MANMNQKDQGTQIDRTAVARRAYELYLARGRQEGRAMEDWVRAENELRAQAARKATTTTMTPSTVRPAVRKTR
jgi:hypothetical protein